MLLVPEPGQVMLIGVDDALGKGLTVVLAVFILLLWAPQRGSVVLSCGSHGAPWLLLRNAGSYTCKLQLLAD